jgi:hypothetical protein
MRTWAKRRRPGHPNVGDDADDHRLVEQLEQSIFGHAADTSDRRERELPSEDGRHYQDRLHSPER